MRRFCLPLLLVPVSLGAIAAIAAEPGPATCRAARDAALARIAAEEVAMRTTLDADAAILEAPTYHLSETENALLAEFAEERARIAARYEACLKAQQERQDDRR